MVQGRGALWACSGLSLFQGPDSTSCFHPPALKSLLKIQEGC